MKQIKKYIIFTALTLPMLLMSANTHADLSDIFNFVFNFGGSGGSGQCSYTGDVRESFKRCNPSEGIRPVANIDVDVQTRSDFRDVVSILTRRIQIIASILAIAGLVFVGFLLVAPVKEETKTKAKKGFLYATLGFFLTIIATILVNVIVNVLYDIFG